MGGLIARGLKRECNLGKYVIDIISIGTPHMGVTTIPMRGERSFINKVIDFFVSFLVYD